ncbi:glycosyltransferase family 2 protein [Flavobacterium sp. LB1P71]|uniref:glycosyltransferase family 2 protein n=1 Tax=unclassified Flavobacterium TaxID=196869 RepID=UPI003AAC51DD
MKEHKISVIMPVYNCEMYIKEAVDSILNQTYINFEFLILDDASTDCTVSIIKKYNDTRIQLIEKPINTGYTNSLNLGLQLAKGKYIARMDGDDISFPERFARQISFLEANQEVVLCGSLYSIMGSDRIVKVPEHHDEIKLAFLKGNCIAHPSVMMRKQVLDEFAIVYDVFKEPAEDYDLWVRLMLKGRLHNLQEVLLDYRTHNEQVTKRQSIEQKNRVLEIKNSVFKFLELELLPEEGLVFDKVINNGIDINFNDIGIFQELQMKLLASNRRNFFEPIGFKKEMLDLEKIISHHYFLKRSSYTTKIYFEYLKIKKFLHFKFDRNTEIKLAVKSLIFYKP